MNDVGLHLVLESVLGASLLLLGAAYWKLQTKKELAKAALEDTARSVQDQLGSLNHRCLF
jgi:hypothetical protein